MNKNTNMQCFPRLISIFSTNRQKRITNRQPCSAHALNQPATRHKLPRSTPQTSPRHDTNSVAAQHKFRRHTLQNYFQALEINFRSLEIYFKGLEIYFKATEKVFVRGAKEKCPRGEEFVPTGLRV